LNYTFDAVGNITQIIDNAQQTHYFNNQVIAPTSTFEYDALYRLISATGREKEALGMPTYEDFVNDISLTNPNSIQNYVQKYEYDVLGNMLKMKSVGNWTRNYSYDNQTNRLLGHDLQQLAYTYDNHGNMLTMPHLSLMNWSCKDELISAGNGTFTSFYNYDIQENRTRKVVDKGNIIETRYYIGGYEVYRKEVNQTLDTERTTLNIADDTKVFVRIEQKTGESEVVRYQYDNHLGSACLELDENGQIISYEEYHPFGTTSYRSGRSETEVSLKRYKYNGKERDEETGLYAYGMRYYAAWLCRFVSCDPLQFKYAELTPFQYASNRPITGVDLDGLEWAYVIDDIGNITISVNVKFENNTNWSEEEVNEYKNAINTEFNAMFKDSFGDNYSGIVTFEGGDINEQIIPSIMLYSNKYEEGLTDKDLVVSGETIFSATAINTYDKFNNKKESSELGLDTVHELLHTLRLDHPFETTQSEDSSLINVSLNNYETTTSTSSDIYYNIMNYGSININGQNLKSMWQNDKPNKITKGQLEFMKKEIDLQVQGAGKINMFEYWQVPFPGKQVTKQN
jgi:RHS repeat-associated protein